MPQAITSQISRSAESAADVKMLNLEKLAAAEFHTEPYEYLLVDDFLRDEYKTAIIADFPEIERHGSFPLATLKYGSAFGQLATELFSKEFAEAVGRKFSIDLAQYPTMLTVRGW